MWSTYDYLSATLRNHLTLYQQTCATQVELREIQGNRETLDGHVQFASRVRDPESA